MAKQLTRHDSSFGYGLRLMALTAVSIFCAEALVMLLIESWVGQYSMVMRAFLDATLLMICVFPTLYVLVFKEMEEKFRIRLESEQTMVDLNYDLEQQVQERTARLQQVNDDLLAEVQARARVSLALGKALKEAEAGRQQLSAVIDSIEEGLLVVDAEGQLCLANPVTQSLLDELGKQLTDCHLLDLFPGNEVSVELNLLFAQELECDPVVCDWPLCQDGTQVVHLRRVARIDWNGEPAVMLLFQVWNEPKNAAADAV